MFFYLTWFLPPLIDLTLRELMSSFSLKASPRLSLLALIWLGLTWGNQVGFSQEILSKTAQETPAKSSPDNSTQTTPAKAPILVVLWFDTEDYILPASDDAALRLATWLKSQGIRATFKVVGEKAKVLKERGRTDVIEALKAHEIGYHSTNHSQPPSPAMYLNGLGWEEGIREFERREGKGLRWVEEIFGTKASCYGQPGSSWGPQSYPVLRKWDMVYLDSGKHVSIKAAPCRVNGVLNLYSLEHTLRADLKKQDGLDEGQKKFSAARDQLLQKGGGIVSIVYHPCEFVHEKFWDGVNFSKGASPDKSEWKLPERKTPEEEALAWRNFEEFIRYIARFPEVRFITAREARTWYPETANKTPWDHSTIHKTLESMGQDPQWVKTGQGWVSAAEILDLTTKATLQRIDGKSASYPLETDISGPSPARPVALEKPARFPHHLVKKALIDLSEQLKENRQIPPGIWLGSTAISPESFLAGIRAKWLETPADQPIPAGEWEIPPARLKSDDAVEKNEARLWNWVIFPEGFRASNVMALARRQAWTFKPAELIQSQTPKTNP